MTKTFIPTLIILFACFTTNGQTLADLEFLIGTWKVEGKETYEVWEKSGAEFTGSSYKIKNGEKVVTENLSLKNMDGKIIYEAIVKNQNDEKGVPFTLNPSVSNFSFENPTHDFPTKIIYSKINENQLMVQVLGADGKGFSLKFIRQ